MKFCEMLFSEILNADHSLFDAIHWREEMICKSGASPRSQICSCKSGNCPQDHGSELMLQLHDGGENT
jgi:hypothetical protein